MKVLRSTPWLLLAIVAVLSLTSAPLHAQKKCVKGKPCGNTCIAQNKTCHIDTPTPSSKAVKPTTAPAPLPAAASASESSFKWVASSKGRTYYLNVKACRGGQELVNKTYFNDEKAAEEAGYTRSKQQGC